MKKSLHISTMLDQPHLLEDLVEKLAHRRYDVGYGKEKMPGVLRAMETSSTETYISGTLAISGKGEKFNMPFITRFLFTCTKGNNDPYKLAWSSSLS